VPFCHGVSAHEVDCDRSFLVRGDGPTYCSRECQQADRRGRRAEKREQERVLPHPLGSHALALQPLCGLRKHTKVNKQIKRSYLTLITRSFNDKDIDNLIEHFRDKDRRKEFFKEYKEIEMLYEIISPDAFLRPFIADYTTLSSINASTASVDSGIGRERRRAKTLTPGWKGTSRQSVISH
jgi:hypothetical protein